MTENLKKITEDAFEKTIKEGVVLVDFYADWCGPCRAMVPHVEAVAEELKEKIAVVKLDIERAQRTTAFYNVSSVPTLILFHNGQEKGRLVGLCDKNKIKNLIELAEK